jgi:hypothetical protein
MALERLAHFPLANMMSADEDLTDIREEIPMRPGDLASMMLTVEWDEVEFKFSDYDFVGVGWNIASDLTELAKGISDAESILAAAATHVPELASVIKSKDVYNYGKGLMTYASSYFSAFDKALVEDRAWDSYRIAAFNALADSLFTRRLTTESIQLLIKYPEAFGYATHWIHRPVHTRRGRDGNLSVFSKTTVGRVPETLTNVDELANLVQPSNNPYRVRNVDVMIMAARRGIANLLLRPNSVFHCVAPIVNSQTLRNITNDEFVDYLSRGIGPPLQVVWEWQDNVMRNTPLSVSISPAASPLAFPFFVRVLDNIQLATVQNPHLEVLATTFNAEGLFVDPVQVRVPHSYDLEHNVAFTNLFEITEISAWSELTFVGLPRLEFRR